ncbi:polymorphic toxin type 24 domain-containing protein [Pluralibacter gergoviae]|uniref:polymorphic toxin type 24 domain-containing protein n=1 Tax=Pluralibacter gergoviae TaxID=61647 RepID=UPI001D105BA1|nr:polymorphic toxin type 24 domain-containing protein [Pluralibacter gergoviae]
MRPTYIIDVNPLFNGTAKVVDENDNPVKGGGGRVNSTPRNAANLKGGPLERSTQVSGRFSFENGSKNGAVYRADNKRNITSYATYDSNGMIIKRVDVTGAAHGGVDTPHMIEYGRNTLPNGQVRVQSPPSKSLPRPIRPDELP